MILREGVQRRSCILAHSSVMCHVEQCEHTYAAAVVTGSDDSTLRRMLFSGSRSLQRLSDSAELGGHASGTGVRALALVPLDARQGAHMHVIPECYQNTMRAYSMELPNVLGFRA